MSATTTLAAYVGGLAVIFAAAFGVGTATGNPFDPPSPAHPPQVSEQGDPHPGGSDHGH